MVKYGNKVWVVGVTLVLAGSLLPIPAVDVVGKVVAIAGAALVVFDK
jgi:hypothetical protein